MIFTRQKPRPLLTVTPPDMTKAEFRPRQAPVVVQSGQRNLSERFHCNGLRERKAYCCLSSLNFKRRFLLPGSTINVRLPSATVKPFFCTEIRCSPMVNLMSPGVY